MDVCTVADVRVVVFRCGLVALGGTLGCLEEEFDYSGDDLELDLLGND